MAKPVISYSTRRALEVQLGEDAGREIAGILQRLSEAVAGLEKNKVEVTPIAPDNSPGILSFAPAVYRED